MFYVFPPSATEKKTSKYILREKLAGEKAGTEHFAQFSTTLTAATKTNGC
jgi:hypothetical protein